jgi:hypothetical protein
VIKIRSIFTAVSDGPAVSVRAFMVAVQIPALGGPNARDIHVKFLNIL